MFVDPFYMLFRPGILTVPIWIILWWCDAVLGTNQCNWKHCSPEGFHDSRCKKFACGKSLFECKYCFQTADMMHYKCYLKDCSCLSLPRGIYKSTALYMKFTFLFKYTGFALYLVFVLFALKCKLGILMHPKCFAFCFCLWRKQVFK